MKKYISLGLMVAVLVLILMSMFLPWWGQSYQVKDSEYKVSESYGMNNIYQSNEMTEDQYIYNCPECSESIAYDKENLEDCEVYSCPDCGERLGYTDDSLKDLKRDCPECGWDVGEDADYCSHCDETFDEPAIWCDYCDEEVERPDSDYYCHICTETFSTPEKDQQAAKGDTYEVTVPYSNYQLANPEKEDGIENKIGVNKITFYLLIMSLIFTIIAMILFVMAVRPRGKLHGKVIIPIVFTLIFFIFMLITPVYFAASWPGALEDDFDDRTSKMTVNDNYDDNFEEESTSAFGKPKQIVKGFMGSAHKSANQNSADFTGSSGLYDSDVDYEWGPSLGWYLALTAMILALMAFLTLFASRQRIAGYRPPPGQYPYRPPQGAHAPPRDRAGVRDTRIPEPLPPQPPEPAEYGPPPRSDYDYGPPPRSDYDYGPPPQEPPPRSQADYDHIPPQSRVDHSYGPGAPPLSDPGYDDGYDSRPPRPYSPPDYDYGPPLHEHPYSSSEYPPHRPGYEQYPPVQRQRRDPYY